jgi:hypothetical protein
VVCVTERTIEHQARELAGAFYDTVRSAEDADEKVQISRRGRVYLQIDPKAFRKTYPTVRDYLAGRKHGYTQRKSDGTVVHIDDGKVRQGTPGWMHFYDSARGQLTQMLGMPHVHENLKRGIYDALLEDREKQLKQAARGQKPLNVTQRKLAS